MIVTEELVRAVADGVRALRSQADAAEQEATAKAITGAGKLIRECIERQRQQADLLAGWVMRHRDAAGLSEDDCHV